MFAKKNISKIITACILIFTLFTVISLKQAVAKRSLAQTKTENPKRLQNQTEQIEKSKILADFQVNRRIASLNALISRVQSMKKVSDSNKNSLTSDIQTQITNLTNLKAKIEADNDPETLKTDRQSVLNAYRIYALFIPKTHIVLAADKIVEIADDLNQLRSKLQNRAAQAQLGDQDATKINELLSEMQGKISQATTQAQNALNTIGPLTTNQGDKDKFETNKTALKNAKTIIKLCQEDLKIALRDAKEIRSILKQTRTTPTPMP